MKELTGRTRCRSYQPMFGNVLLVLEVEEKEIRIVYRGDREVYYSWRDATVEDLFKVEMTSLLKGERQ